MRRAIQSISKRQIRSSTIFLDVKPPPTYARATQNKDKPTTKKTFRIGNDKFHLEFNVEQKNSNENEPKKSTGANRNEDENQTKNKNITDPYANSFPGTENIPNNLSEAKKVQLCKYHGKDVPYLYNELYTTGNLIKSLNYHPEDQTYSLELIYKNDAYSYCNKNGVTKQNLHSLGKKDLKFVGMLEDNLLTEKGHQYPGNITRRTYFPFEKFHGFGKFLDGNPIFRAVRGGRVQPNEKLYDDAALEDVMIIKLPKFTPNSIYPGYALLPQRYSQVNYEAMEQFLPDFSLEDEGEK